MKSRLRPCSRCISESKLKEIKVRFLNPLRLTILFFFYVSMALFRHWYHHGPDLITQRWSGPHWRTASSTDVLQRRRRRRRMDHTLSVFHVSDCNVNVWPFSSPANVSNRCLSGSTKHRTRNPNIHGLRYKSCDFKSCWVTRSTFCKTATAHFNSFLPSCKFGICTSTSKGSDFTNYTKFW